MAKVYLLMDLQRSIYCYVRRRPVAKERDVARYIIQVITK